MNTPRNLFIVDMSGLQYLGLEKSFKSSKANFKKEKKIGRCVSYPQMKRSFNLHKGHQIAQGPQSDPEIRQSLRLMGGPARCY